MEMNFPPMNEWGVAKRLRMVRAFLGMSQKEFADRLGLSLTGYQNYEKGTRHLSLPLVDRLVFEFKVAPNWLVSGQGPMWLEGGERIGEECVEEPETDSGLSAKASGRLSSQKQEEKKPPGPDTPLPESLEEAWSVRQKAALIMSMWCGRAALDDICKRYGLTPETVRSWERAAWDGMSAGLEGRAPEAQEQTEGKLMELYARIGQLTMELEALRKNR